MKSLFILLLFALSTALIGTSCSNSNADNNTEDPLEANARVGGDKSSDDGSENTTTTTTTTTNQYNIHHHR